MIIFVDIDQTICRTTGMDYEKATPFPHTISRVNRLKADGHTIIYWTARGVGSGIDQRALTERQLNEWGAEYDELRLDKPVFDLLIDDKAVTRFEDLSFIDGFGRVKV